MRGQQAMQRSRLRTTVPTPPPASPARLAPISELPGCVQDNAAYMSQGVTPASPWMGNCCTAAAGAVFLDASARQQGMQQMPSLPVPSILEQLCGPGADGAD